MAPKRLYILFALCIAYAMPGMAAPDSTNVLLQQYEDTLRFLQREKIKPKATDQYKLEANNRFSAMLKKALELPGSFDYPFDSLTTISRLTSPDKKFRILNWDVPWYDETVGFYGFVQSYNPQKKAYVVYELQDKSSAITSLTQSAGTPDNWLGMLYYKIIPTQTDKNVFMLLAWQGYNSLITRKFIDVISFNAEGVPTFGRAIFRRPPPGNKTSIKRIVFQYSEKVAMSLTYDEKGKRILFDHLAPPDDGLAGQYQFYGPSFQVDALAFKNNGWEYVENVDARNAPNPNDKNYHPEGEDFHKNKKAIYTPKK